MITGTLHFATDMLHKSMIYMLKMTLENITKRLSYCSLLMFIVS